MTDEEKWTSFVAWCSPGGGAFGYEKEAEDKEGVLWAATVVEAAKKVVKMNELMLECEEFIAINNLRAALSALKEGKG